MGVTKTDFMRGIQCPKMLWLDKHKKEERIIPPEVQARLDQGNVFGDSAMSMFGEFTEVTAYKPDGALDYKQMIENTQTALRNGVEVVCEAAFTYYGNYCAVDILRKVKGGYALYEVKDSLSVNEQFIKDIGFQRYIVSRCGVKIVQCFVVYHGENEEYPFEVQEVTSQAKAYSEFVNEHIWRLGKLKMQKEEPNVSMGEQCLAPYACWYCEYCKKLTQKTVLEVKK